MENPNTSDIIFYASPQGNTRIEVIYEGETFWLSQKRMAELFGVEVPTINEHLKNVYRTGELDREATIRNFRIVQFEGAREVAREVACANLDAIIAVGYRVNSFQATQFRIWATKTLRESSEAVTSPSTASQDAPKTPPSDCSAPSSRAPKRPP